MNDFNKKIAYYQGLAYDINYDPRIAINSLLNDFDPILNSRLKTNQNKLELALKFLHKYIDEMKSALEARWNAEKENIDQTININKNIPSLSEIEFRTKDLEDRLHNILSMAEQLEDRESFFSRKRAVVKLFRLRFLIIRLIYWTLNLVLAFFIEFLISSLLEYTLKRVIPKSTRIITFLFIFLFESSIFEPYIERYERKSYDSLYKRILNDLKLADQELENIFTRFTDIIKGIPISFQRNNLI